VAVFGCGGVGLSIIQGARIGGARQIIAVDIFPAKLEMARRVGATHAVNSAEDDAVKAAQNALDISTYQYKAGTVNYLAVILEQAILLSDQVQALSILTRRMSASVLLIEALGGEWDASTLPTMQQVAQK
jgi:Zn-dependent alcohol dehydrogenase